MMNLPNEIIFVCGQRGGGKSYWVKNHVRSLPRCIIYDTLGEYQCDHRIYDLMDLAEYLEKDQADERLFTITFDSHMSEDDFPYFCRLILARGNMHVIIEEIDLFSTAFKTDPEFLKLLKYGRHYGIQIIGVSRRPAEVSRHFTAQATRFICFQNHEPKDIQYFRSMFGAEAEKIKSLPMHHYLDVNMSVHPADYQIHPPV